ncbi:MAG: GH116 family glycosyl-hydrolase [Christensenellales bacterium]|jgi:non-lysosomal glucosylceramidase
MTHEAFWPRLTTLSEYSHKATQAAFLLGGIGTGNVSLSSRGQLMDWEVFNGPGKGNLFPYTFFALHVNTGNEGAPKVRHTRVLEGPIQPPHNRSHGYDSAQLAGLPRMAASRMRAEYPLCAIQFEDDSLPVTVGLEAYTPFIPLDDEDSALPVAILHYRVTNSSDAPCFVSVAGSMANMSSFGGYGVFNYVNYKSDTVNRAVSEEGLTGIQFEALPDADGKHIGNSFSLCTSNQNLTMKPTWYQGAWYDAAQDFWDDFSEDGRLDAREEQAEQAGQILFQARQRIGSIAPYEYLSPGEEAVFTFYISWHIKDRLLTWWQDQQEEKRTTRNYYSLRFLDAFDVVRYTHRELPRLQSLSLAFHQALFMNSSLPREVLNAASANITVLRSTTCFRIEDGSFFGWEGCFDGAGCCDGNCTHVWNYAQTLAHLFPRLEQSMRRNEFLIETRPDGAINFRSRIALQDEPWRMPPAIDGQCGSIIRLVREWRISGDKALLTELGPTALKALDFSIRHWDRDGDGLPDSAQHNTYDIEFYGPNPLSVSVFLAALKAGAVIAGELGDTSRSQAYLDLFETASMRADALLFNGDYYVQRLTRLDEHPYQHGTGCLSDQLFGQFLAHGAGLGYILPKEHVRTAMRSIHRHNFRKTLTGHESVQRCFALPDEPGLLLCSWPNGGRPRFPFVYSNEVWTGVEYQVAAGLIYEGLVDEGLEIVRAARSRHDGYKRNPFNEVECGHHYARSMASWALIPAISGFERNPDSGDMRLAPKISPEDFRCFYSTGDSWGICRQWRDEAGELRQTFEPLYPPNQPDAPAGTPKSL